MIFKVLSNPDHSVMFITKISFYPVEAVLEPVPARENFLSVTACFQVLSLAVGFSASPTQQKLEDESDLCHCRIWKQIL